MKTMRVLSLFDGISCGQVALTNLGIKIDEYYASEIEDKAIAVTQKNFPNTKQIGDICKISGKDYGEIDLLMGGSPCQGFSRAGDGKGFKDDRSKLYFEYLRVLEEVKPKYFLLENVVMKKEWEDIITEHMGVKPIKINSSRFSAQSRNRLYWTNIPITSELPDSDLILSDILEPEVDKKFYLSEKAKAYMLRPYGTRPRWESQKNELHRKSGCVVANYYKGVPYGVMWELQRRLTPLECERLQTLPDHYTKGVANTHRYKAIGNGWNVKTIEFILKHME